MIFRRPPSPLRPERSGCTQEPIEQNVLEIAPAVENREHDDRAGADPINEAIGADDEFAPPANAKKHELRYDSPAPRMEFQRCGGGFELREESFRVLGGFPSYE
jgi:hypothetical protein